MKSYSVLEHRILLGECAEESEELLNRARPRDLWFHLSDFPGCQCVLFCNGYVPDDDVVMFCAGLVKRFSARRNDPRVAVDVIERKFVIRDRSKPGSVIMLHNPIKVFA